VNLLRDVFISLGLNNAWAVALAALLGLAGALMAGYFLYYCAKRVAFHLAKPAEAWQDALQEHHVSHCVAWLLAAALCYQFVLPLMVDWPLLQQGMTTLLEGLLVMSVILTISRIISTAIVVLEANKEGYTRLPFKVLGQALQIVLWSYGTVVLLSVLTERDVSTLLTSITAVGAVLVYVFRDSILGWVAGVQIAGNDLAHHGDWITMPGHGADGVVFDIALTTIKVRNWDNSISTIPSYALVSEGFCNWSGMFASGGRRIKRALAVDASTVALCDAQMLERLLGSTAVQQLNDPSAIDGSWLSGSSRVTNLSCYRRWLQAWIRQQPGIHPDMMAFVRELEPDGRGIYLEIYAFSSDTNWEPYEQLQADLYDYALAVLPEFGLRVFQEPSGADLRPCPKEI
jgi:miniconductance mechanosensitive channel